MQVSGFYHYPLYRAYAGGVTLSIAPNVTNILAIKNSTLILKCKQSTSLRYGTAQFKLDIYTCVAQELFNKFVKPLASYTRVHDTIS